jgi:hypothetical protein
VFELTYRIPAGLRHRVPAAAPQEVQLVAENGTAPFSWSLVEGRLPSGMTLRVNGVISGAAAETGEFALTLQARDASGLVATGALTLEVTRPNVAVQALLGPFFGNASTLTEVERVYLDGTGNKNGVYDLGDMRIFFLANPDLPMTVEQRALVRTLLPAVSFGPPGGGR